MSKKFLAIILSLAFVLTSCGGNSTNTKNDSKEKDIKITSQNLKDMRKDYKVKIDNLSSGNYSKDGTINKILKDKKLVIGTNATYPPFEFRIAVDNKTDFGGIDIEISKLLAKKMGVKLEIEDTSFDSLVTGVDSKMYDLAIAGMNKDPERNKIVDFTDDYIFPSLVLLIRKEDANKFKDQKDIPDNFKFGNQMGTVQEKVTNEQFPESKKSKNSLFLDGFSDLIVALQAKQIDGVLVEEINADAFIAQNPDIVKAKNIKFPGREGFAIASKKGDKEFQEYLNKFLKEIKENGSLEKIIKNSISLIDKNVDNNKTK